MRGLYKNNLVSVVGETRGHWLIQCPIDGLKLVPMHEIEFECVSLLDWVRSEEWEQGVSFEDFSKKVAA